MKRSIHSAASLRMPKDDYWFGFEVWNRDKSTLLPGMSSRFDFTNGDTRIWVVRNTNSTYEAQLRYAGMVAEKINPGESGAILFAGFVDQLLLATNNTVDAEWIRPAYLTFSEDAGKYTVDDSVTFRGRTAGFALSASMTNTDEIKAFLTMRRK